MKLMKKALAIILAVTMLILAVPFTASAEDKPTITVSTSEAHPGETVDVTIAISGNPGITVFRVNVAYDDSLTLVGVNNGSVLNGPKHNTSQVDKNPYKVYFSDNLAEENNTANGVVVTFTFQVADNAEIKTVPVTVSYDPEDYDIYDKDSNLVNFGIVNGGVQVLGKDFAEEGYTLGFKNSTVTYDSNVHTLEVTGVPEFASVAYKLADGTAFTGAEDAGTYNVTATVTAPGYTEKPLNATLTINKKEITVNAKAAGKVYDGTDAVIDLEGTPTIEGYIEGDDLTINPASLATVKFASKDVGTHAINHSIEVIGSDKDNYEYTINVPKATISKRPASITAENKTVKVGDDLPEYTVVTEGVVEGEELVYTVSSTAKNTNAVKNYPITVKADAKKNPNYEITVTNGVLYVIDKTAQDVTVTPVEDKMYGGDDFMLEAVVGEVANESKVVFTSETPDVVSVTAEGCVMIVGAGTAKITVSKAGDDDYADFSETVEFTVEKKPLTITADNQTVKVGNELPELTYQVEGLLKEDTLTGELATTAKNTNTVKDYPITQGTLKASENYDVTFVPGTLSVIAKTEQDVSVEDVEDVTYGDGTVELVVTEGENVTDSLVVYTAETDNISVDQDGYITILGAGTAKVTVSKAGDDEYADFEETVTFTVNKKNVTVTADNKTATKGGEIPELTYTVDGLVGEDAIEATLTTTAKNTNTVKEYPITVKVTVKNYPNYNITLVNGVLSVIDKTLQDITVTSNVPSDLTYGDEGFKIDVAYGAVVTEAETTFVSSDEEVVKVDAEGNVTVIGAGEATITVSKAGNDTIADFAKEIDVVVAKKPVTITAKDASKKVGAADPALEYEFDESQLVGDDAISGNVMREEGEEVGTYIIGPGTLSLSNSANYEVTFVRGTFTIFDKTPQDIEVTSSYSKTYGDAPFALEVTEGVTVSDADVTFTSDNEDVATVDAEGNVTIVGAGTAKITVAKAGNADLADFSKNVTVTVAKKAIKVVADAKEKYVGQDTPELTYTVEGELVAGDAFTGELTVNDLNKAGGKYDIKIGTLALNDNYKVTFVGAKLSVLAKLNQEIELGTLENATYGDEGLVLDVTYGDYNEDAEAVFASTNEDVATVDADGNITIVGAGSAKITVAVAGNYKYNDFSDDVTLTVAKKKITVTADNLTKKIGTDDPELTYTTDVELVEGDEFTGALERKAGETLGTYVINQGTLALNDNYTLTFVKGTFTIVDKNPQTVDVAGVPETVTYGGESFTITATSAEVAGAVVTYESSDENVIAVDENGVATIGNAGEATITVTVAGNDDYADAVVTKQVVVNPKEIAVTALDLVNKTVTFDAVVDSDLDAVSVDFGKLTLVPEDVEEGQTPANYVVTGLVLTGEKNANYVLTTESVLVPISDEIELVTVTVVAENGTVEGAGAYLAGSEVTLTATPASGYKFSGWYVGEEKKSSDAEYTFALDADIELTAKFAKKTTGGSGASSAPTPTRVVYFQLEEGNIDAVSVNKGSKVARPEDPTLEGYTFEGWFVDAEFTAEFDFDTVIEDSVTVYAKWTEVEKEPDEGDDGKTEDPVEWENNYNDVDENDWFYETVKSASVKGIMNGMSEKEFGPYEHVTRAMLVTILYRADGEAEVNGDVTFEDVDLDAYYGDALIWAAENGIVNGYSETEFAPNAKITREQIAAIMLRYAIYKGVVAVDMSENLSFKDADDISEYAVSSMNWAVGQGIITGYENNTIKPKNNATRAEVATIVIRFLAKLG